MIPQLRRLRRLLQRGLEETRPLWPDLRQAFGWVHQMAHVLSNNANLPAEHVAQKVDAVTEAMGRDRGQAGALAGAVDHFLKVTASYRPGLFHCYRVPGLPRTNNDLAHLFGSHRHHERRATGRKTASPTLVLRGSVRLLAATATRLQPFTSQDLADIDHQRWLALRRSLDHRRQLRALRTRFRRNPEAYLTQLEQQLLQPALPP